MPIGRNDFREWKGGDIEAIKESQRRRYKKVEDIDEILSIDEAWRAKDRELSDLQEEKNKCGNVNKTVRKQTPKWYNKLPKATKQTIEGILSEATENSDALATRLVQEGLTAEKADEYLNYWFVIGGNQLQALVNRSRELSPLIEQEKQNLKNLEKELDGKIRVIGNYVHESVPVHNDEKFNGKDKIWGEENRRMNDGTLRHHHEILYMIGGYEPERGTKVASHRAYFLTGAAVRLNLALQAYSLDFLRNYRYKEVYPPFYMKKSMMAKTAQLEDFDEALYHISEGGSSEKMGNGKDEEDGGKYLIATSEQPISAMHADEWLQESELPIRYAGLSTCFRKEAGSHGRDAWGIFRVHQFEKIEQFVLCNPETSWAMHEEMIGIAEEFYQSLNIPYEVVNIVSGELNNAAAKKYDLEGWFPTLECYRELVSCSNCTDYQSRAMEIRYVGPKKDDGKKPYVHMLNATLCATTRTICCILENYQDEDGVHVPQALRSYMGGLEFIPYVRAPLPAERPKKQSGKKGGKKGGKKKKNQKKN